jgi:hypothetical protein
MFARAEDGYRTARERLPRRGGQVLTRTKRTCATLFSAALLYAGIAAPTASAQANQDGLINVAIGDITIQDINIGVAAQVAANVCGLKVGPVAVLGRAVDRSGNTRTVCTIGDQTVRLTQN